MKTALPGVKVYADTSVYGGCCDVEFEGPSRLFFDQVRAGVFRVCIGAPVVEELAAAPGPVQEVLAGVIAQAELIAVSAAAIELRDAYIEAEVVGRSSLVDALHVALATLSGASVLVSWNFKHIVHREKAPRYNAVNALRGLPAIGIYSPAEVVRYEEDV
jgi:hypothetical protein